MKKYTDVNGMLGTVADAGGVAAVIAGFMTVDTLHVLGLAEQDGGTMVPKEK